MELGKEVPPPPQVGIEVKYSQIEGRLKNLEPGKKVPPPPLVGIEVEDGHPNELGYSKTNVENKIVEEGNNIRTTINFMKQLREKRWKSNMGEMGNDPDTCLNSKDALPEQLQDYTCPMVCIGSDVVSLYPNLDVAQVAKRMKEAVLASSITWQEIDWLEAARYVALNWP